MAAETQQEVGQAMSLPVQDVLDTINRDDIDKCLAIYHNEHYILGFPSTGFAGVGGDREQHRRGLQSPDPELVRTVELGADLFRAAD